MVPFRFDHRFIKPSMRRCRIPILSPALQTLLLVSIALLLSGGIANSQSIRLLSGQVDTSTAPEFDLSKASGDAEEPRCFLLQFNGPIQPEWIERCETIGARFHVYLPDYAYLISCSPNASQSIRSTT